MGAGMMDPKGYTLKENVAFYGRSAVALWVAAGVGVLFAGIEVVNMTTEAVRGRYEDWKTRGTV